jgi:hypothetical protein
VKVKHWGIIMALFSSECAQCGSTEHATKDCPHGLFSSNKCAQCGYQLKTGQNIEPAAVFLYHELMTKKTQQHKKYEQLASRLSLKSVNLANKVSENLPKVLQALKAAFIVANRQRSGATCILNPVYGKLRRGMTG